MQRWSGVKGFTSLDVDQLEERARVALAPLRSANPMQRELDELEVYFVSSGHEDPGNVSGLPENCYPPDQEDIREVTKIVLQNGKATVLNDTLLSLLASDPVLLKRVDGTDLEPEEAYEPDYDAMNDYRFDK